MKNTKHPLANFYISTSKDGSQKSLPWEKRTHFSQRPNAIVHLAPVKLMEIFVSLSDGRRNWTITDEHAPRKQDFSTWLGRLIYFPILAFRTVCVHLSRNWSLGKNYVQSLIRSCWEQSQECYFFKREWVIELSSWET